MRAVAWACAPFANEKCCNSIFVDLNLSDHECMSFLVSRAIGFGLVGFSCILKVPQLVQIVRHRSGRGISIPSLFMEISANVLGIAYHRQRQFPFATFGETIVILIQNLLIAFFVTHFSPKYNLLSWNGFIVLGSCLLFAVERGLTSDSAIRLLWNVCLPLSIAYKLPQIWHTYRAGCKGELSKLSCFLTLMGSTGRVFTTIRELGDWSILSMYLLNMLLNGTILVQSIIYPKERSQRLT